MKSKGRKNVVKGKNFGNDNLKYINDCACVLLHIAKGIALLLCVILIITSIIITYEALQALVVDDSNKSIQDGLYVMILLEMLYVVFSFIKYGSINVSLVINVGIIAAVKALIFKLEAIDFWTALSFTILIVGLGIGYLLEMIVFNQKKKTSSLD